MRRLLLGLLLATMLFAKDDVYLGAGPYVQTQPYKDADPVVLASPVIFFDNALFYIRWTRLGMYFYGQKSDAMSWGLSVTAQPQILGYYETASFNQLNHRDPTPILQGMQERESSWEAGIAFSAESHDVFGEFLILHDVLNRYNALKLRAEAGMSFTHGRWYFVPSLLAIWLSQPFADYYYGVRTEEADLSIGRPAYRSDAALNLAAQAYLEYSVTPHWHLLANFRADRFARTVADSPLVDEPFMYSGMLSVMYSFNLFGEEKAVLNVPEKR